MSATLRFNPTLYPSDSTPGAWSPSGTTKGPGRRWWWQMSSVLLGRRFLPEKRVGALFELQRLPSGSHTHRVLGDFQESLGGEAHGLLVPPYYPVCWLVFLCIRHYIRDSKVSFPLNCKLQVMIHYYLLLPIITYFFSEMLHTDWESLFLLMFTCY